MARAMQHRHTRAHRLNEYSSRSHCLMTFVFASKEKEGGEQGARGGVRRWGGGAEGGRGGGQGWRAQVGGRGRRGEGEGEGLGVACAGGGGGAGGTGRRALVGGRDREGGGGGTRES